MQDKWYKRLQKDGFQDIEDTAHPQRPLKEWHSIKACSKKYVRIQAARTEYQDKIEVFLNHITFGEACRFVIKHKNQKFTLNQVRTIWILHTEGRTTREIAREFDRAKSRVDDVLKKLREWMKYI